MASEEPTVDVPTALPSDASAWNRSAMMFTQRRSISTVCGYSSASMKFFDSVSVMRSLASGSIHVVTKEARLSAGLPSSISSSVIS